ncbi:MAG TPA: hypothetical protein VK619_12490, partial [Pyrinomonadaceae bacterium]|nr:hypothetical protein [Pyrinomonadaceae bacterium]
MTDQDMSKQKLLRALPSVDALLRTGGARALLESIGSQRLTEMARAVTDEMRTKLLAESSREEETNGDYSREALLAEAERKLEEASAREKATGLRRVINASGVILHTN